MTMETEIESPSKKIQIFSIEDALNAKEQCLSRESLINLLNVIDKKNLKHPLFEAWQHLLDFKYPFSEIKYNSVWITNYLLEDAHPERKVDEVIVDLEGLIESRCIEPDIYLHVATYYFSKDNKHKARELLRNGIKAIPAAEKLKLYYCENLAFSPQNKQRIEEYLLPIINNPDTHKRNFLTATANYLLNYYLFIDDMVSAHNHISRCSTFLFEDSLLNSLAYRSLRRNGEFADPGLGLCEWGKKSEDWFFEGAPDCISREKEEVLDFIPELFVTKTYEVWKTNRKDFKQSLYKLEKSLSGNNIYENRYGEFSRSLANLILGLTKSENLLEDRDYWLLMYFYTVDVSDFIPNELREEIPRLKDLYPTKRIQPLYLKYMTLWGKYNEVSEDYVQCLYDVVLDNNDGDTSDLDNEWLYSGIFPERKSDRPSSRPLPYFANAFIATLQNNEFPISFYNGLWRHVVRPTLTEDVACNDNKLMKLLDVFNELIPDGDPLFIKGWGLINLDQYQKAMVCFQRLITCGNKWYGVYRNLSYCASKLGNHALAYEYEKSAHNDPDIIIPEDSHHHLEKMERKFNEDRLKAKYEAEMQSFYEPQASNALTPSTLHIDVIVELIALIEYFSIPNSDQFQPLFSQEIHWLPSSADSHYLATKMISNGSAYFTNRIRGEGLSKLENGGYSADFQQLCVAPNIEPIGDWALQLGQLHERLEQLRKYLEPQEVKSRLLKFLIQDLESYARERIYAYGIEINFKPKFTETAEHCLSLLPLQVCYGIYYHEIEDAAAKQREDGMADQHTVNYALSCARSKATRAKEYNWDFQPYDRNRSASPECAVIKVILESFPGYF